jgi:FkbM family methyltransferase
LRDIASDAILFKELFFDEDYACVRSLAFEPKTILDAGANIGLAALYLRSAFPAARIFGFEPGSSEFAVATRNFQAATKAEVFNSALGDYDGRSRFACNPLSSGGQHLLEDAKSARAGFSITEVPLRRADSLIDDGTIGVPDLVKIDVEGAEVKVLRGLQRHLDDVKAIIAETHSTTLNSEVCNILRNSGFTIMLNRPRAPDCSVVLAARQDASKTAEAYTSERTLFRQRHRSITALRDSALL